jgi:hypothetical protein
VDSHTGPHGLNAARTWQIGYTNVTFGLWAPECRHGGCRFVVRSTYVVYQIVIVLLVLHYCPTVLLSYCPTVLLSHPHVESTAAAGEDPAPSLGGPVSLHPKRRGGHGTGHGPSAADRFPPTRIHFNDYPRPTHNSLFRPCIGRQIETRAQRDSSQH